MTMTVDVGRSHSGRGKASQLGGTFFVQGCNREPAIDSAGDDVGQ